MKLYATTTSERASKGQGGNKHIEITLQGGEYRDILIRFEVNYNKDFPNYSLKMIDGDINFMQALKNHLSFWLDLQKGKKEMEEIKDRWDGMEKEFPNGFVKQKGKKQKTAKCTHQNCDDDGNCHACDVNVFK